MNTLYDVLEVSSKASKEIIDKAYKTLAKKYHPDLQTTEEGKKIAETKMVKINEAYDILSDNEKRAAYDQKIQRAFEEKERQTRQQYAQQYTNTNNGPYQNNQDINNQNINTNYSYQQQAQENNQSQETTKEQQWKEWYNNLSPVEQKKVKKKIERNAAEEYRVMYADYLRSRGYKVKHQWTAQEIKVLIISILVIIAIMAVLWIIPPTHDLLLKTYQENPIIAVFVNVIIGIIRGTIEFFKHLI